MMKYNRLKLYSTYFNMNRFNFSSYFRLLLFYFDTEHLNLHSFYFLFFSPLTFCLPLLVRFSSSTATASEPLFH